MHFWLLLAGACDSEPEACGQVVSLYEAAGGDALTDLADPRLSDIEELAPRVQDHDAEACRQARGIVEAVASRRAAALSPDPQGCTQATATFDSLQKQGVALTDPRYDPVLEGAAAHPDAAALACQLARGYAERVRGARSPVPSAPIPEEPAMDQVEQDAAEYRAVRQGMRAGSEKMLKDMQKMPNSRTMSGD